MQQPLISKVHSKTSQRHKIRIKQGCTIPREIANRVREAVKEGRHIETSLYRVLQVTCI